MLRKRGGRTYDNDDEWSASLSQGSQRVHVVKSSQVSDEQRGTARSATEGDTESGMHDAVDTAGAPVAQDQGRCLAEEVEVSNR